MPETPSTDQPPSVQGGFDPPIGPPLEIPASSACAPRYGLAERAFINEYGRRVVIEVRDLAYPSRDQIEIFMAGPDSHTTKWQVTHTEVVYLRAALSEILDGTVPETPGKDR